MTKKRFVFKWLMMGADWAILMLCFNMAYWIKFKGGIFLPKPHPYDPYFNFSLIVAIYGVIFLHSEELYKIKGPFYGVESFLKINKAIFSTIILSVLTNFLFKGTTLTGGIVNFSRLVFMLFGVFSVITIFAGHVIYQKIIIYSRKRGMGLIKLLIVGTGEKEKSFYQKFKSNPQFGYNPLGFVVSEGLDNSSGVADKILGKINDVRKIITQCDIEDVALSNPTIPKEQVLEIKAICDNLGANLTIIPNVYGLSTVPAQVNCVGDLTFFTIEERILKRWNKALKRLMDICLSAILLIVLSPVLIIIAAAIKMSSEGPILFRQIRLGCGERQFYLFKFRTMAKDAEKQFRNLKVFNEADGPIFKLKNDPRVTRIGKLLRKYSLDEVPQLWNVLKGDMSLVGPRPCLPSEAVHFRPYSYGRFNIKPGITGFAQVNGRSDIIFEKRCELDVYYMENWSILMDIVLLLKTIPVVLSGKGSY